MTKSEMNLRWRKLNRGRFDFLMWKRSLLHKYGISVDEYIAMFFKQHGMCAICGHEPTGKMLAVDHDHSTKKVRGLLCDWCNRGLGMFRDSVGVLEFAQSYLDSARM